MAKSKNSTRFFHMAASTSRCKDDKRRSGRLVGVIVGVMLFGTCLIAEMSANGQLPVPGVNINTSDDTRVQGRALRAEIERTYQQLKAANALKVDGRGRNPIGVLDHFLSRGMSFDKAVAIIYDAGFSLRGKGPAPEGEHRMAHYFIIDPFDKPTFARKTTVFVTLYPTEEVSGITLADYSAAVVIQTL